MPTFTFSVHEAKTQLSKILTMLNSDNEIIISRYGKPIARIAPYADQQMKRQPGAWKGKVKIDESFFDPLPEEELAAWNELGDS